MVSMPKINLSNLENIKHLSYESEELSVIQDTVKTNDTIEWLKNFTDFDIDEYFIEILKTTN
jgi:hypothetical protein